MELFSSSGSPATQRTECAIIGIFEKGEFSQAATEFDARLSGRLTQLAKRGDLPTKQNEVLLLTVMGPGLLLSVMPCLPLLNAML